MISSCVGMLALSLKFLVDENSLYIPVVVFGIISLLLGHADLKGYENKTLIEKKRISRHLTHMLAGAIAVVTAVLFVNADVGSV
ncbi:hypothetical protein MK489_06870 [Myxococcota bacterium]|nr:hypothetical protein [Myxococcota bacterium]